MQQVTSTTKSRRGTLIAIDGLDGTGKATQVAMLKDYLLGKPGWEDGVQFTTIDFPRYGKDSCIMVEKNLKGDFGDKPEDVDPYTASSFYAIDRSLSFKNEQWGDIYRCGGMIISDRYTASNIIHQASKFKYEDMTDPYCILKSEEYKRFVKWLFETEYNNMGIPQPDLMIFLQLSETANEAMLRSRKESAVDGDIYERNKEYLNKCRNILNAMNLDPSLRESEKTKYVFLTVSDERAAFDKETIHEMILKTIREQYSDF